MVKHVVLECEKYERDRRVMMHMTLTEQGHNRKECGGSMKEMGDDGTAWTTM